MKKGLLITVDFWPRTGGVATYYASLLSHVREFEPVVLTTELPDHFQNTPHPKYHVLRAPFFFGHFWPKWLRLLGRLWQLQKKEHFDFFLVGDILPVGAAVWIFSKISKKPYMVFLHGTDFVSATKFPRKRWLAKKILQGTKLIVANSKATQERIISLDCELGDISVVYPAVPKALHERLTRPFLSRPSELQGKKILLSVSRLVERKGIEFILDALKKLDEDILYVIIGDGPLREKLENKIKAEGLSGRVLLLLDASDEKKWHWFSWADLFVLAPYEPQEDYEGFGIVYLEAASFGLSVVASRSGGIPEAVIDGETGILVDDPKNIFELARAIKKLLADPTRRKLLGENAQRRAKEEFLWDHQAKIFEETLRAHGFL